MVRRYVCGVPLLCLIWLTVCLCLGGSLAKAQTSPLVKHLSALGKTFLLEYEAKTEGALERFMAEIESLGQAHPAKREPLEGSCHMYYLDSLVMFWTGRWF